MENEWKAIALIYSGKPDPQWRLTKMQADHFLSLLNKAKDAEKEVAIPAILGYRGMKLLSGKKQFLIYHGIITSLDQGVKASKEDEDNAIEKYLLKTAPGKIQDLLRQQNIL